MIQADSIKNTDENKLLRPEILIIGIGAIAFGAAYLLRKTRSLKLTRAMPTDPPPIIIKSGSFIIETNQPLSPDQQNKRSYKKLFNGIKGIRVVTYNELVKADSDDDFFYEGENSDWRDRENIKVVIELERCIPDNNGVCTSWSSPPDVIEIFNNSNDLEITIPATINLSKSKNNKKNNRIFKHEDENNEFIRFTKVTIINTSQRNLEIKKYPIDSSERKSREYFIAIYNEL